MAYANLPQSSGVIMLDRKDEKDEKGIVSGSAGTDPILGACL